jgi:hypothetical protein
VPNRRGTPIASRLIVPSLAGPARLVPLAALADKEISLIALRLAAQRGRLGHLITLELSELVLSS